MEKKSYQRKLVEALSVLPESKSTARFLEAKAKMAAEARNKPKILHDVVRVREDRDLNNLVPHFSNYVLIGRASTARILANQQQISLPTLYLPNYRGEFFLVDADSVTRRTYTVKDINARQLMSFQPPLGGTDLVQPWLIGVIAGAPILTLAQANIVIERNRRA